MFDNRYGLEAAVLEGRKTMTRRLIPQKHFDVYKEMCRLGKPVLPLNEWLIQRKSKYKIGEEVAIAQSYFNIYGERRIDGSIVQWCNANGRDFRKEIRTMEALMETAGYDNKMFVKADLMSHRIRITDIKVERLQDITEEDAMKEGIIEGYSIEDYPYYTYAHCEKSWGTAKIAFENLITKMMGSKVWKANPYIFAYTFERIR